MRFSRRRQINGAILLLAVLVVGFWLDDFEANLNVSQYLSGWLLLGASVLLGLYNLRKKVSVLPLLSNAVWLQVHLYLGLFAVWLFLVHMSWQLPSGPLEGFLALVFALIAISGVVGIWMSRVLPSRLRREGEEVIYERIPGFRIEIKNEAEQRLVELVGDQPETSLKDYYLRRLHGFFASPGNFLTYMFRPRSYISGVISELQREERYFNTQEREFSTHLQMMIRKKYELELHYVYQSLLKLWLFVHVPLTYGMYILLLVHVITVYALRGGY